MEITEIRIVLRNRPDQKLKAYAMATFDRVFVVRNLKVIQGPRGLFVAMPSRKVKEPCAACGFRNEVGSRFCNQCAKPIEPRALHPVPPQGTGYPASSQGTGSPVPMSEAPSGAEGEAARSSDHRDIAHPITAEFREYLQRKVLEAYHAAQGGAAAGAASR